APCAGSRLSPPTSADRSELHASVHGQTQTRCARDRARVQWWRVLRCVHALLLRCLPADRGCARARAVSFRERSAVSSCVRVRVIRPTVVGAAAAWSALAAQWYAVWQRRRQRAIAGQRRTAPEICPETDVRAGAQNAEDTERACNNAPTHSGKPGVR